MTVRDLRADPESRAQLNRLARFMAGCEGELVQDDCDFFEAPYPLSKYLDRAISVFVFLAHEGGLRLPGGHS